jgi:FkbM family methyltransferase
MNRLEAVAVASRRALGLDSDSTLVRAVGPAYELLLRTLYGRRGITRILNGDEPIRVRPAFRALQADREPAVFRTLQRLVKPGMVVFDVGASIGEFAIVLARWCGPGGRVVAFEPSPAAREALRDHLELNGLVQRVEVVDAAVSDYVGPGTLHVLGRSGENTLNAARFRKDAADAVPVPVTTIDAYCHLHGVAPAVIKIDIEGLELHALRGAANVLARHHPAVVVELHPGSWRDVGESAATAATLIAAMSYRVTPIEGQQTPFEDGGHVLLEPEEAPRQPSMP